MDEDDGQLSLKSDFEYGTARFSSASRMSTTTESDEAASPSPTATIKEKLRCLARSAVDDPTLLVSCNMAYDMYCPGSRGEFSVRWYESKKQLYNVDPLLARKTIVDFICEDDDTFNDVEFTTRLLRFEINCYFASRFVLSDSMITVGKALIDIKQDLKDEVIGHLSQIVGLWWGITQDEGRYAVLLSLRMENKLKETAKDNIHNPGFKVLEALVQSWVGLSMWNLNQHRALGDIEAVRFRDIQENPDKYKGIEPLFESRVVPVLSSLNYSDEVAMVTPLINAVDILYTLISFEEILKQMLEDYCPAMILTTSRLLSLSLGILGHSVYAIKAWHVTCVLAKVYDRKALFVLAASELLKLVPVESMEYVRYAERINEKAQERKSIKNSKAMYYRLILTRAVACYHNKNYKVGLKHLVKVLGFRDMRENFDTTHLVLSEAAIVLSWYKPLQATHNLDFSEVPEDLQNLTPSGLASKGFKLISGLARPPDQLNAGWNDLFHNYFVLSTIMQSASGVIGLLKEAGKLREIRCFASDTIYCAQQLGLVSRSIQLLLPLAELDLAGRSFDGCLMKIAGISKTMEENCPSQKLISMTHFNEIISEFTNSLKDAKSLEDVPIASSWVLEPVLLPHYHYGRNGRESTITSISLKSPPLLDHSLRCTCYICAHPTIIPDALRFLDLQARFAMCNKKKVLFLEISHLSQLYHQRFVVRLRLHMDALYSTLALKLEQTGARRVIDALHKIATLKPRIQNRLSEMQASPSTDLQYILSSMNDALSGIDMMTSHDFMYKLIPIEIASSAIFNSVFGQGLAKIRGFKVRDGMKTKIPMSKDCKDKEQTSVQNLIFSAPQQGLRHRDLSSSGQKLVCIPKDFMSDVDVEPEDKLVNSVNQKLFLEDREEIDYYSNNDADSEDSE